MMCLEMTDISIITTVIFSGMLPLSFLNLLKKWFGKNNSELFNLDISDLRDVEKGQDTQMNMIEEVSRVL